jgi:hypothetical protein
MCSAFSFWVKIGQKTTGSLLGYLSYVTRISAHPPWLFFRVVNVSVKSFKEDRNTHFISSKFGHEFFYCFRGNWRNGAHCVPLRTLLIEQFSSVSEPILHAKTKAFFLLSSVLKRGLLDVFVLSFSPTLYSVCACVRACVQLFCAVLNNKDAALIFIVCSVISSDFSPMSACQPWIFACEYTVCWQ